MASAAPIIQGTSLSASTVGIAQQRTLASTGSNFVQLAGQFSQLTTSRKPVAVGPAFLVSPVASKVALEPSELGTDFQSDS